MTVIEKYDTIQMFAKKKGSEKVFLNYRNVAEKTLFEDKRILDLKTWKDISCIDDSILDYLGLHRKENKELLDEKEKDLLLTVLVFQPEQTKIEHLREHVVNQEKKSSSIGEFARGMVEGTIIPLEKFKVATGNSIIEETKNKNVPTLSSLYEYLATGKHIGTCGFTSSIFGIYFQDTFHNIECHKGRLPIIAGSKNSPKGNHAWIEAEYQGENYIIDTSMLVAIPTKLKEKMGYLDTEKPKKLKDTLHYITTTNNTLTTGEENLLDCLESLTQSNEGKMSYRSYLEYKEKIKEREQGER